MRYTLDPETYIILDWRNQQDMVLNLLLNEMIYVPESQRRFLPYRVVIEPQRRILTDQMGRIVCEFSLLMGGVIIVDWIRSWKDFVRMEETAQELRNQRQENKRNVIPTI